jgi:hypothetical protein
MRTLNLATAWVCLMSLTTSGSEQIEGLWTGKDVNGPPMSPPLSIKLSTNFQGAVMGLKVMELPGTFTYALSQAHIIYFTNQTAELKGTLSYDAQRDVLTYLPAAPVHPLAQGPVFLLRDTNQWRSVFLGSILGATNKAEVTARLLSGKTNRGVDWSKITSPHNTAQPDGAANRGQPRQSETNRESMAAGPGR